MLGFNADGQEELRLEGSLAAALERHLLSPGGAPPPLLRNLFSMRAGLAALLAQPAFPLTPRALLGRGHWELLFVELTATCNERCAHCYASSGPERSERLGWETSQQ